MPVVVLFFCCLDLIGRKREQWETVFVGGFNTVKKLHILGIFLCMLRNWLRGLQKNTLTVFWNLKTLNLFMCLLVSLVLDLPVLINNQISIKIQYILQFLRLTAIGAKTYHR